MDGFGLGDLAWVLLIVGTYFLLPTIIQRLAPGVHAFFAGEVIQVRVKPDVTSSSTGPDEDDTGPRTSPAQVVQPQQDQSNTEPVHDIGAVLSFLKEHNLSDDQAVELLAIIRRTTGDHFLSANKIRDVVGGGRDEILAAVASHRPKPTAPRTPSRRLERPVNGW